MTAVQFIEEGIKAREKHWQDQYQQGYQRALSDIMLYIEEAKQMEKEQMRTCASFWRGRENQIEKPIFEQYYKETYQNEKKD